MTQPQHTPNHKTIESLANAYTKAVCQNPRDMIYTNIERALMDCPSIVRACNSHYELVAVLEELNSVLKDGISLGIQPGSLGAIKIREALARAKGES